MQQEFSKIQMKNENIDGIISSGKDLQNILSNIGVNDQCLLDRTKDIEEQISKMKKDFKSAATVNSFIQNSPEKVLEAHVIKATIVQDSDESSEYDNEDEYDNELDEYDNENEEAEASEKSAEPE